MANISSGASLSATNFNALFTRLDNIRKKHLNANGQSSAANTRFSTAFSTNIAAQGVQAVPNNVQRIKDNLTTLAESAWLDTTFASQIPVPGVGSLINATTFNTIDNAITNAEAVCPNYSQYNKYGQYGEYGAYGAYGQYGVNYSNYYQYGNYYQYRNYAQSSGAK